MYHTNSTIGPIAFAFACFQQEHANPHVEQRYELQGGALQAKKPPQRHCPVLPLFSQLLPRPVPVCAQEQETDMLHAQIRLRSLHDLRSSLQPEHLGLPPTE